MRKQGTKKTGESSIIGPFSIVLFNSRRVSFCIWQDVAHGEVICSAPGLAEVLAALC